LQKSITIHCFGASKEKNATILSLFWNWHILSPFFERNRAVSRGDNDSFALSVFEALKGDTLKKKLGVNCPNRILTSEN